MDDGSEAEFGPGDVGSIPPGHDVWIVGNEPFICIDFPDCRTMAPLQTQYDKRVGSKGTR